VQPRAVQQDAGEECTDNSLGRPESVKTVEGARPRPRYATMAYASH